MSRNNQERLGARQSDAGIPIPETAGENSESTFSFTTPTEFVDLPTGGRFYPEGHPLHGKEHIEIRYMTAKDEDILSSKSLLKKGVAIDRLLQNIIVDKSINTNDLYIGDKNAVLVAARITGYGEDYDARITCPSCMSSIEHTFDLSKIKNTDGAKWEDYNIKALHSDRFLVSLPISKVEVEVKLLKSKDENYLVKLAENKKKKKLPESSLTDQIRAIIVSVNGDTSDKKVISFIEHMPARDSRYLRTAYDLVVPNVNMKQIFPCNSCEFEQEVAVPFTAGFFWPNR